ncbi:hypothetical protein ACIRG5_02590 [Lentzea sp. NPDC102401]|uniref:hypothetical protein n=1 Tax=Lentzea sp. NPDC102401 TaxID=3364128 RepID=UPI0037FEFC0B
MDPLSRLAERLWWFTTGGDPGPLLEDAAVDEAQAVLEAALRAGPDGQAEVLDRDAVACAALVHWFRYTALPRGSAKVTTCAASPWRGPSGSTIPVRSPSA